jgi:hypothetical protein
MFVSVGNPEEIGVLGVIIAHILKAFVTRDTDHIVGFVVAVSGGKDVVARLSFWPEEGLALEMARSFDIAQG